MKEILHLEELVTQAKVDIEQAKDIEALEIIRVKYLGREGHFTKKMQVLRNLSVDKRPTVGIVLNQVKKDFILILSKRQKLFQCSMIKAQLTVEKLDISLPGRRTENGGFHPISLTIAHIENFFNVLGFEVVNGPEIEDDYHNFDALNIPAHHPARANHDTFWIDSTRLLRTQTSSIQIRAMKVQQPPIRIIASGRVYRNDYDQFHTPMFHQMEGLVIDVNISFSNLKGVMYDFLRNFLGENLQIRFRPSYFPFTEPSAEVDIMGKDGNWLEVLGCGMVHPNVLCNGSIDTDMYSGFAFGIGIERLSILRYGINDSRLFFKNDLRFLKQFKQI